LLSLEKLFNEKYFLVKEKFNFVFKKVFFFYFKQKTLFRNYKKFKNIVIFANNIKFNSQTFNYFIFFFEYLFFNFIS